MNFTKILKMCVLGSLFFGSIHCVLKEDIDNLVEFLGDEKGPGFIKDISTATDQLKAAGTDEAKQQVVVNKIKKLLDQ